MAQQGLSLELFFAFFALMVTIIGAAAGAAWKVSATINSVKTEIRGITDVHQEKLLTHEGKLSEHAQKIKEFDSEFDEVESRLLKLEDND